MLRSLMAGLLGEGLWLDVNMKPNAAKFVREVFKAGSVLSGFGDYLRVFNANCGQLFVYFISAGG
jgi:hypothetical protein